MASLYARDPIPPPPGHRLALDSVSFIVDTIRAWMNEKNHHHHRPHHHQSATAQRKVIKKVVWGLVAAGVYFCSFFSFSWFLVPCSWFLVPFSFFFCPCSLFLVSFFLFSVFFFSLFPSSWSVFIQTLAWLTSASLVWITNLVILRQRSCNLWNDWKEGAHGSNSCRNQKKSNRELSWTWKSWTDCEHEGCGGWVYDNQMRSKCPQCIRPLPEPTPAKSQPVTSTCFPCGEGYWEQHPRRGPHRSSAGSSGPDRMAGKRHYGGHIVDDAGQVQDESNDTGGGTGTDRDAAEKLRKELG